jgi:hypothetical protein
VTSFPGPPLSEEGIQNTRPSTENASAAMRELQTSGLSVLAVGCNAPVVICQEPDSYIGESELNVSATAFQLPSACLV